MRYQVQEIDGKLLDAHFDLDNSGIDYRSRGGSKKSGTQINSDYGPGLRLILTRLSLSNIEISGIWVNSSTVQGIPKEERLILTREEFGRNPESAFTFISNRMVSVGQLGKPKGGNSTKKIRIEFKRIIPEGEIRKTAFLLTGANKEENPDASLIESLIEIGKSQDKNFGKHYRRQLEELEDTDRYGNHTQSGKEQGILRAILFKGLQEIKCAVCHRTLPSDLMVAAHIKPRSKCSTSERKNPNIVMPVCKIGCDEFFEKGYLIVDNAGKLCLNSKMYYSSELKVILGAYEGKHCNHFNEKTVKFFEFKRGSFDIS